VASGRSVVVGVNGFTGGNDESDLPLLSIGPEVEELQRKRLDAVRAGRSPEAVAAALARLAEDAGHAERNLMPAIFAAVEAYATVGEMVGALADVFGRWEEQAVI
jgi:methylmalonyl-CoA mutase N-terminal domain/subunit